jgi:hypothetical protein
MSHPLRLDTERWTTNADTLAHAQVIGEQLDALVATALQSRDKAQLHETVCALDLLPQWYVVNMPGLAFTRYYEGQRQALHAHALTVFGPVEGPRVCPALEYTPLHWR